MPTIPVGDVLRAVVPSRWGWLRWLLAKVKGVKIQKGDTTIVLDQDQTLPSGMSTTLDSKPHQPGPPLVGRR